MKKKTAKAERFIEDLHDFIISDPQFRDKTSGRSEVQIQTEVRPLILRYLEDHFAAAGYKDAVAKTNQSFYWEGQEGALERNVRQRSAVGATRTSSCSSRTGWRSSTSRVRTGR